LYFEEEKIVFSGQRASIAQAAPESPFSEVTHHTGLPDESTLQVIE